MIIRSIIISIPLILSGCLSNNILTSNSIAHENVDRLSQLQIGMTKEEVYQIMRYPSTEDQITTNDGCYDIWFYITKSNILDQNQLVARNLTPLIFKDGVFIGMGRSYYNLLVQKTKQPQLTPSETPPSETEPMKKEEERENIELEKTLTPPNTPATSKPKDEVAPAQKLPGKPVKKTKSLSMCSKPKQVRSWTEPDEMRPSDEDSSHQKSAEPKLDEEDREMLDQEREENFNNW
jgi:outer membrane protein assembly factor BamE (lipoprotein component of BamABCDE complex)